MRTVEDMQERLHNLCDEIDCLKYELEKAADEIEQLRVDYNEASIDGAADERAKIVAWIKMVKDEYRDPYVVELADRVEAGEHLK